MVGGKFDKKEYKIEYFLIISFIFILYTNNFYSFEETLLFGGSDGRFYIQISKYAPYSGEGIDYIKVKIFSLFNWNIFKYI